MEEKLAIAGNILGFISSLGAMALKAFSDSRADSEAIRAAFEQHTTDFLKSMRDGAEFDHRHEVAMGKLEAAIEAAKRANNMSAKSSTDDSTKP